MRFIFLPLLITSFFFQINSVVPAELPFLILFVCMIGMPLRTCVWVTVPVGFFLDIYSPIKGLSLIAYLAGSGVCYILARHVLTHRSLPAFFILGISGWLTLTITKVLLFVFISFFTSAGNLPLLFSVQTLARFASAAIIAGCILVFLYLLAPEHTGIHSRPLRI